MKKSIINKWESTGLKHFNDFKTFIEYSNNKDNIYNDKIQIRNVKY